MKKILLAILLFFFFPVTVYAEDLSDVNIIEASGAENLSISEILTENGVSFSEPQSILNLTPSKVWNIIKDVFESELNQPVKLFASLMTIVILTSFIDSTKATLKSKQMSEIYELICILVCVAIFAVPICSSLETASETLAEGSEFMLGFVPVFAGAAAAGGHITSASGYNILVLSVSDIAIQISGNLFMPFLSMCLSLAIVDSACNAVDLSGIINGIKKFITWGLGLIMAIFTGLLSIQSIVGSSADTVTTKAAKYVISNSIPVVGGAASDAYTTVRGSLNLLKNGVGGIGMVALGVILLPSLLLLIMHKISFFILGITADVFGTKKLCDLFRNINSVLSVALAVTVCFMLMFIVSTAIIMNVCTGIT